jgi:SAM-dependent methyltransferase
VRPFVWKACYELLAAQVPSPDWAFMNYGYAPLSTTDETPELEPADEADRLSIQLYARALSQVDLRDADVLEVGSGRGGGASYVSRYRRPRTMTGLDFSRRAVQLSRRDRRGNGLTFTQGDALAMPFPDSSFDTVINVESSHCYSSMTDFLAEVNRVLRPGGSFCFADLRDLAGVAELEAQFEGSGLTVVEQVDITAEVLEALRVDNERKLGLIDDLIPRVFRRPFRAFAGIQGTTNYDGFVAGRLRYLSAHLTKPAPSS